MRKPINLLAVLAILITMGVVSVSAAVKTTTIRVTGMTWGGCASSVEQALKKAPGVIDASVSFEKGEAFIRYDDRKITINQLYRVINSTGFKAVEKKSSRKTPNRRARRKASWNRNLIRSGKNFKLIYRKN